MYPALGAVIVLIATPINIDSDGQMKANICVTVSLSRYKLQKAFSLHIRNSILYYDLHNNVNHAINTVKVRVIPATLTMIAFSLTTHMDVVN